MQRIWKYGALALLLGGAAVAVAGAADDFRAQVQADWQLQDTRRTTGKVSTQSDAAGAVDGVKDGKWGFHTGHENKPWWQVDLLSSVPLERVVIYNRCDAAATVSHLMVLLSADGKTWQQVYQHDGTVFYGATDGKPLTVDLHGAVARYLRIQVPDTQYFYLDEVEVYATTDAAKNIARGKPADQSSISQWSVSHNSSGAVTHDLAQVLERGRKLADDLRVAGVDVQPTRQALQQAQEQGLAAASEAQRLAAYQAARWAVRKLALANPLLDFDRLLVVKAALPIFSHMSDQYYGWWSRPGGGLYILDGFKTDNPRLTPLVTGLPEGTFLRPDLAYDAQKILFAYSRYYPKLAGEHDKETKANVPEEAFYHLFEINVDGTGLRQITHGRYDDFDGRYLPDGRIVFLSTRRGQAVQYDSNCATATLTHESLPDSYVRCGGDKGRPVAVYTLHTMNAGGTDIKPISAFEMFEWTPSVAPDGRVLYARWDYIDRDNMPYMKMWSTNPDGTNPRMVWGNYQRSPFSMFEGRCVPGSSQIVFTASAHHSITGGSLVLLDPRQGADDTAALTRLTPEVCYPEVEGWPKTWYANPWPLAEQYFLTAWSATPLVGQGGSNAVNALGTYLYDAHGNLELLWRDKDLSTMNPIPLKPRTGPAQIASSVAWEGRAQGKMVVLDIYQGLTGVPRGTIKELRIIGVPAKTQPDMNSPNMGLTADDPGKFVLGTVPVEADDSAYFRVPSGVTIFFQALDSAGVAVQTMRSATYVQPGQTLSCVGCHESRLTAPPVGRALATAREASKLTAGPPGSWPMHYDQLVQPVLEQNCVKCHNPTAAAPRLNLTATASYAALTGYGHPSLREVVHQKYHQGHSVPNDGAAQTSPLLAFLNTDKVHHDLALPDADRRRLILWLDLYGQRQGAFGTRQEEELKALLIKLTDLLAQGAGAP